MIEAERTHTAIPTKKRQRIIGHLKGPHSGPTVVFFAGIHGNEPAGVKALEHCFAALAGEVNAMKGQCYGILGNLKALDQNVRFLDEDLNRMWLPHRLGSLRQDQAQCNAEEAEMVELYHLLQDIISNAPPPFYVIDLHTTSGETAPFVVMNDSLLNRRFTQQYPLPVILGIEEYLTGALLSHINERGYVAFGFESGQHESPEAVKNALTFIHYTLGLVGVVDVNDEALERWRVKLARTANTAHRFYEIYYQHLLRPDVPFTMQPGFVNFESVPKGTLIAKEGGRPIIVEKRRQLFMPLYQDSGYEGYYFIRSIPAVFLWLSKYLRKAKLDSVLAWLPGVRWASPKKSALIVDKRIARFFAKSFFHLLGYRTREIDAAQLVLHSRERPSRKADYKKERWYGKPRS